MATRQASRTATAPRPRVRHDRDVVPARGPYARRNVEFVESYDDEIDLEIDDVVAEVVEVPSIAEVAPLEESTEAEIAAAPTAEPEEKKNPLARGGISISAITAGAMLSFGTLFPLSALCAGILVTTGNDPVDLSAGAPTHAGGLAFITALMIAYFFGGYASGRMARGAGLVNGLFVPLGTVLFTAGVVGAASGFGGRVMFNLPFASDRLPIDQTFFHNVGVALGSVSVAAMLFAGMIGGAFGGRWHTKLEKKAGLIPTIVRLPEQLRAPRGRYESSRRSSGTRRSGGRGWDDRSARAPRRRYIA